MIYLITATPGSGKTLWAMREIFQRVNQDEPWNIFTNIDGIKLDTAQPLKDSFEDYPARSLVVIDEAQKITHFSKKYKHPVKNANHPEVEFLQTHRHADHLDIIYITQAPRLLNPDVLDMVGTHYHLHRPMGMKMATWWMWKYHQLNPNTKSSKADAEDTGTFTYPKNLFGMYKSSDGGDDSHGKIKIPMKIINAVWMLFLVLAVTAYLYFKSKPSDKPVTTVKTEHSIKTDIPKAVSTPTVAPAIKPENLDIECRKSENLQNKQCIDWYNDLSKNGQSAPAMNNPSYSGSYSSQTVSYNPSKPYDDLKVDTGYQVVNHPRFSGCMKINGQYRAYTEQGTYLKTSKSVCHRLMSSSGDRPYDYFSARSNSSVAVSSLSTASSSDNHVDSKTKEGKQETVDSSSVYNIPNNPSFPEKDITKPTI